MRKVWRLSIVICVLICFYSGYLSYATIQELHKTQQLVVTAGNTSAKAEEEAKRVRMEIERDKKRLKLIFEPAPVQLSRWAEERGLVIHNYSPESSTQTEELKVNGNSIGKWQSERIRIRGEGSFNDVMAMFDWFRSSRVAVKLESYTLTSGGKDGKITEFEALITVFYSVDVEGSK